MIKLESMDEEIPVRGNAIFWIEVEKIRPNPFQPRREFDELKLRALADSIRQYGVLQPLLVTRKEQETPDGGLMVEYELIAGERRWRAAQLAGVHQVPAVIRIGEETDKMKLEMAIIENLQREDLNPVERARAFDQLNKEFRLTHLEIAKKVGRSREYVSNTVRILGLPDYILQALQENRISEGHARTVLMLSDRPAEQRTLFQDIIQRRLTVRDTEEIARRIAFERLRRANKFVAPELVEMEQKLTDKLGARVRVEKRDQGGKVTIDAFSNETLQVLLRILEKASANGVNSSAEIDEAALTDVKPSASDEPPAFSEEDLYNIKNFTI